MGLRVWSGERAGAGSKGSLGKGETVTQGIQEPVAPGAQPVEEPRRMMDYERLAEMPLESLLYYILVGEGRRRSEPTEG